MANLENGNFYTESGDLRRKEAPLPVSTIFEPNLAYPNLI